MKSRAHWLDQCLYLFDRHAGGYKASCCHLRRFVLEDACKIVQFVVRFLADRGRPGLVFDFASNVRIRGYFRKVLGVGPVRDVDGVHDCFIHPDRESEHLF